LTGKNIKINKQITYQLFYYFTIFNFMYAFYYFRFITTSLMLKLITFLLNFSRFVAELNERFSEKKYVSIKYVFDTKNSVMKN